MLYTFLAENEAATNEMVDALRVALTKSEKDLQYYKMAKIVWDARKKMLCKVKNAIFIKDDSGKIAQQELALFQSQIREQDVGLPVGDIHANTRVSAASTMVPLSRPPHQNLL